MNVRPVEPLKLPRYNLIKQSAYSSPSVGTIVGPLFSEQDGSRFLVSTLDLARTYRGRFSTSRCSACRMLRDAHVRCLPAFGLVRAKYDTSYELMDPEGISLFRKKGNRSTATISLGTYATVMEATNFCCSARSSRKFYIRRDAECR